MPHIATASPRQSVFVETGLTEESSNVPSPLSPRKTSRRLAPLLSGLRITPRSGSSPRREPESPSMSSPAPPNSPASSSIQFRRPNFSRHSRTKSLSVIPGHVAPPPLIRAVSSPSGVRFNAPSYSPSSPSFSRSPLSPLRTTTPSPPPSLAFDSFPSLTPVRSRSPSVSSLETIADIPDAEQAAELEPIPVPIKSPTELRSFWGGLGSPTKGHRKRWSVCGGEKRIDLDLETIWEEKGFNPHRQMQVAKAGTGKVWIVDSESTEAHE